MRLAARGCSLAARLSLVAAVLLAASAIWPTFRQHAQYTKRDATSIPRNSDFRGNSTFAQLTDHSNASLGTFEQRYAYDTTYYAGPGSPVLLMSSGEDPVFLEHLTSERLTGVLAERIGAAIIILEHRYFGKSSPFTELTTANLTYLTPENSILDLTNFALHAELPFDRSGRSNAANAPWVLMGASYAGMLAAWTESVAPGTFWAYHASSAPVQLILENSAYWLPVQEGMPKNCSQDVAAFTEHMDEILTSGSAEEVRDLKAKFGFEMIEHSDDFMMALIWGPANWQRNQFYNASTVFSNWCDSIENSVNQTDPDKLPSADGVGLEKALQGYAAWARRTFSSTWCNESNAKIYPKGSYDCFDSHNASNPRFTDTNLGHVRAPGGRAWDWMQCDWPIGFVTGGLPEGSDFAIMSRLIDPEYYIRQCSLRFPTGPNGETFGLAKRHTTEFLNGYFGGWNARNSTRVQYVDGEFDPWREAGVSSTLRPGGPMKSTPQTPVRVVPGGFHGSDLVMENGRVNAGCKKVQDDSIEQLVKWVDEFWE